MTTKPTLVNPTDDQISAAVAELVAGYKVMDREPDMTDKPELIAWIYKGKFLIGTPSQPEPPNGKWWYDFESPKFATSADAVLPLLEIWRNEDSPFRRVECHLSRTGWIVDLRGHLIGPTQAKSSSISLAGSIALLRAHGVTVTFTNPTRENATK